MRLRSPTLLLLLFTGLRAGGLRASEVDVPKEVRAMVGSDVILNCIYADKRSFDLRDLFVYWQTHVSGTLTPVTYYLGNNSTSDVNSQYKDRAWVSADGMKRGDFSLHLYNVTPQDENKFNCVVIWKLEKILDVEVMLHVAANYSVPVVSALSGSPQDKELTFTCTSWGGYPRPNVYWINKTDNSLLDEALQNSTVSVNALGLYDVVSVLRVPWVPNLNVDCCIENVLLLQNLTVSSQTETEVSVGTKDSITENPGDTQGRTSAGTVVAILVVLSVAAVAVVSASWVYRSRCAHHQTYTYTGAWTVRPELELADHA